MAAAAAAAARKHRPGKLEMRQYIGKERLYAIAETGGQLGRVRSGAICDAFLVERRCVDMR